MRKVIKNHKLGLGIASLLAIMALVTGLTFIAPTADAGVSPMLKVVNSFEGPEWCGYKRYFCDGTVVTSSGFYYFGVTHYVTTHLNQCGGGGEF